MRSFEYNGSVQNHFDWSTQFKTSLVSSFGVDSDGDVYVVALGGTVWRVAGFVNNDEIFFYRSDGTYRYYDIAPNADLGGPLLTGSDYSPRWEVITPVDFDGDGQDEMLFYRDGTFKYYRMRANGTFHPLMVSGTGFSLGWSQISSLDLDGDLRSCRESSSWYERLLEAKALNPGRKPPGHSVENPKPESAASLRLLYRAGQTIAPASKR